MSKPGLEFGTPDSRAADLSYELKSSGWGKNGRAGEWKRVPAGPEMCMGSGGGRVEYFL